MIFFPSFLRIAILRLAFLLLLSMIPSGSFAQNQMSSGQRSDSLERALRAYRSERPQVLDVAILQMLNALGNEYSTSNPVKALEYAEEAKKAALTLGDKQGQADALRVIGMVYQKQGSYDNAAQHYFDALKLYEELGDKRSNARVWNDLGATYSLRNNYRQAIESYQKAQQIYTLIGDKHGFANTLSNIAILYDAQDSIEAALSNYSQSIIIWQQLNNKIGIAAAMNNIGLIYLARQYFSQALPYLQKAALLFEEINADKAMRADVYTNIALAYIGQKDYPNAKIYLNQALRIAQETHSRSLLQACYVTLSDFYAGQGNYKLALDYARLDNELKDTIFNDQSDKRLANAEARYELVQKQRSIEKSQRDLQLQEQKIQLQNQRFVFLGIGFVLVAAVVVLLANGYRIKQRAAVQLQHKNDELEVANEEIAHKNQHLEELNNEKNEFFGIVAHDLKNPILSIKLLAQLLHDQHVPDAERQRFTNTIMSSSDQMSRIISNLLNVNALERGAITLNVTAFNISVAAYSVFEEYEARGEAKGIKLHFDSFSDADCLGDQTAVMQILENLISNAVKYSPSDKNVWIRVYGDKAWAGAATRQATTPACVRIEVQDEGPGLSDDDKKKLFGKFMRLSAKPTSGEQSTGLGLSIVKKMVHSMNGEVWCESVYGEGATFIVELPQAE
jgi:signal transduction histidine kinase/Flp pilus assembly protein TadD